MKKILLTTLALGLLATPALHSQTQSASASVTVTTPEKEQTKKLRQEAPPTRHQAQLRIEAAQTKAFYSPELQAFLQKKPSWQEIQAKVQETAKTLDPDAFTRNQNPFERLDPQEATLYRAAHQKAAQDPGIQALRNITKTINEEIETLMDKLTPGYKKVRDKLQDAQ